MYWLQRNCGRCPAYCGLHNPHQEINGTVFGYKVTSIAGTDLNTHPHCRLEPWTCRSILAVDDAPKAYSIEIP